MDSIILELCYKKLCNDLLTAKVSTTHTHLKWSPGHRLLGLGWAFALIPVTVLLTHEPGLMSLLTASSVSQHSTLYTICCARVQPARKSEPRHLILKPRWAAPPSFHPPAPPEGESVFLDSRSLCRKHPIVLVHLVLNLFLPASRMISAASPRFVLLTAATICINFLHL